MNFSQKLLSGFLVGLSLTFTAFNSDRAHAEVLDQSEIRSLARNITVKIVDINNSSNGSGVIYSRKGNVYSILTNQHVAGNSSDYEIYTPDGASHQITYKEEVPGLDLMVVQFQSEIDYKTAELGNSEEIAPLQLIYVAGYPAIQADLDIVDGKIRSIRQDVLQNPADKLGYALVYTNQTLPGSSGGAILDEQGYLVGINGEAERDIRSGRDISRGIPINLFISLSFNNLPEGEFELEEYEVEETEAERRVEEQREEERRAAERLLEEQREAERREAERQEEEQRKAERRAEEQREAEREAAESLAEEQRKAAENQEEEVAYLPTISNNANYALAYNIAQTDEEKIRAVAITPDGRTVVTSSDRQLKIWNGQTGSLEQIINAHEKDVKAIALSSDGATIISGGDDGQIKIWNRYTAQLERTLAGHEDEVNSLALNLNGNVIVSGGGDKVKVWSRYTGKLERTLEGHESAVKSVAISDDGETIASGGQDRDVRIWQWRSWELKHVLKGHEEEVRTVAISTDGSTIVSGSGDRTIRVWDAGGNLKTILRGHEAKVDSLVLSNDGHIISGSRDRTIKIWDLQTQTLEQSLTTEDSEGIEAIAASADKGIVVSGGREKTLAIWHLKR
ncbi:MAG: trypsin-like peptidase domain-containing protein [Cyanobacteria bacterium J06643_13]